MAKLFGTDGIRGVANTPPMTTETVVAVGQAMAHICRLHDKRHRILIGKDTRLSGYMIENALTAGICSKGVDVLLVGPIPTPGIAFLTQDMRADAGIVISASHNPYQDNGIKIFSRDGFKLSDELETQIEELVSTGRINEFPPTADAVGKAQRIDDALGRYIVFCKNTFPEHLTLSGMRIVMDCANGATYKVAPTIFTELGAEVTALSVKPNGMNINDNCGALYPGPVAGEMKKSGADLGLAFDGDGDRLIAVDEKGNIVDGDHLIAICAAHLKKIGRLSNDLVIITPMSNFGLRVAFDELGIRYEEAAVGDRYVLELMKKRGSVLGGEQSGHIIFRDLHTTGDGIISALQILAVMQETGKPLSELAKIMENAPQELINVDVKAKPPLESIPELQTAVRDAEAQLGRRGRVLVRYSGTQLVCRVMVEGPTADLTNRLAQALVEIVKRRLG